MMKIKIEISNEEIPETGTPVQQYAGQCPVETQDSELNEKNKLRATEEYNYGPSTDPGAICGNCSAFNMSSRILDCLNTEEDNLGYCETHRFTCEAEKTCDSWVAGGPLTDEDFAGHGDAL
jgi:hypothetical protein